MQLLKKSSSINSAWLLMAMALLPLLAYGQHWAKAGNGFDRVVLGLYTDSATDTLYGFGNFFNAGGVYARGVAKWAGLEWDSIAGANQVPVNKVSFSYNGQVLIGISPVYIQNGSGLDTFEMFSWGGADGHIVYDNELVAFGAFDSINKIPANWIARWNGNNWSAFDTTKWGGTSIYCAKEYQGNLYIGGLMYTNNPQIDRIARWDGTQWLPVGNGLHGGVCVVWDMEVYKGDLYVAGVFSTSQGNPGNGIARWNGSEWLAVGNGVTSLNGGIRDLQVYNNELYAAGQFTIMDGIPISSVAKWDGVKWCGVGFSGDNSAYCMAVYNNELYVGGDILIMDGDTMNHIMKWIGANYTDTCAIATAISETKEESTFALYPNPTTNQLTIQATNLTTGSYQITTTTGQLLLQSTITQPNFTIDVSTLPPGLYFLQLTNGSQRVVKRFVKQ